MGAAFQPLVSLAVAVILYDAGMSLDLRKLHGHTRRVVVRLIALGVPITSAFAAVLAGLLLDMSSKAALMLGAILVVPGPTMVGPLLVFIRPTERLQRVLSWEGSLGWVEALAVPQDVRSRGEVLDPAHQFIAVALVQGPGLKGIGEVDGLRASARCRFGFGGGEESRSEAAPPQTRLHPQALQFAAVAPGPSADAGDDPASVADEDR